MTVTTISFTNNDLGTVPFDALVVDRARKYIVTELNSVTSKWSDNVTRFAERMEESRNPRHPRGRRDYTSIEQSNFFVRFEKGNIIVTNAITDDAGQFRYLYYGNGDGLIIPKNHKFLKFYSRKNTEWVYSTFVRPISPHIIRSFKTDIKDAIMRGLMLAQYEIDEETRVTAASVMAKPVTQEFEIHQKEALEMLHGKQNVEEQIEAEEVPLEDQKEMLSTGRVGIIEQLRGAVKGVGTWLRKIW